jgi:hypothetical protein
MPTTVLLLLLLLIVVHSLSLAAAQRQPSVALPGCQDACGNITVPYPFGIGAGCYRVDSLQGGGFQLECDESGPSPPRLTIFSWNYRLGAISLEDGEATSYVAANRECYNSTGGYDGGNTMNAMSVQTTAYLFSAAKNRLVALGCPNLGFFVDGPGNYVSGCMSVCHASLFATPGSCTGVGCCQIAIPLGMYYYEPHQRDFPRLNVDMFTMDSTPCRYVFLVETEWFDGNRIILNRTDDFEAPVVLDWAVRNVGNCSAAKRNATDFACRSEHSECFDVKNNGDGYRCKCSTGYEGNPYLDKGCTGKKHPHIPDEFLLVRWKSLRILNCYYIF